MGEKIEKLVDAELNLIPAVVKPFLHKADADVEAKNFMTMGFMAYAYGKAFDELAEPALAEWPKRDFITQPMVYLARHSMELHLKKTIKDYQDHLGDRTVTDHHSLLKLWNLMTKLIADAGYVKDDVYAKYCVKLLNHVHDADPDGERYRYPHDTKGQPYGFTKVDLEGLVKAHWNVTTYAEGSAMMLAELVLEDESAGRFEMHGRRAGRREDELLAPAKAMPRRRPQDLAGR